MDAKLFFYLSAVIMGGIMSLLGLLAKKHPTQILGHYWHEGLNEAQQKTFLTYIQKAYVITGIIIVIGCSIHFFLNWNIRVLAPFLMVPFLITTLIVSLKKQKIKKQKS